MADIFLDFSIKAPLDRVFQAFSRPEDLAVWWTRRSEGTPAAGADYKLDFGPGYEWQAKVTRWVPNIEFELELVKADGDWTGTRVGCELEERESGTWVRFHHTGWPNPNEHYRTSCNCWALYLRVLRRYLEHGETVAYEDRLDA